MSSKQLWLWLAPVLLIAAVLRVRAATLTPLWFDEIYTVRVARGTLAELFSRLSADVHPPLHELLVWGWSAIGGEGEMWQRSMSIVFGLATVLVTFYLGRSTFGERTGLLAALMLAIHPVHIYFSQEVRSYALLWLLLPMTWWFGWKWVQVGRRRDAVFFVIAAAIATYTHYFTGLVLAFLWGWGVFALRRQPRRLVGWMGLYVAIAILFAPQLPLFLAQTARITHEHWIRPSDLEALLEIARRMAYGALYVLPVFAALAIVPLARPASRGAATMLWLVWVGPIMTAWTATALGGHLFTDRYMFFALPAVCCLVAAGALSVRPTALKWLLVGALLIAGTRATLLSRGHREARELAAAARYVAESAQPGDVLFCGDTHTFFFFLHHYPTLGRHRLLWFRDRVPYYEGAAIFPDSALANAADFARRGTLGPRWWGIRVVHGGVRSSQTAALFDAATSERVAFGNVQVWGPVKAEERPEAP